MPDQNEAEAIVTNLHQIQETVQGVQTAVAEQKAGAGELNETIARLKTAVAEVQEQQREIRRREVQRAGDNGTRLVVPDGPYAGMTPLDVRLMRSFAYATGTGGTPDHAWKGRADEAVGKIVGEATPDVIEGLSETADRRMTTAYERNRQEDLVLRQYDSVAAPVLREWHKATTMQRAAMDSVTAGAGDELVATLQARELWMDVNLQTLVAPLIPTMPMPSNPFQIPRQLGDVNFYPGAENIATTSTAPGTGRTTLTAYELVGQVPYSFTLEEDAIIAMLSEIRAGLVRNVAETLDDIILMADTTTTNNINADGVTIAASTAAKGHWLIGYDGLVHLPLVDNTSQANDHAAAVSDDMFNEVRAKLGKYGARPSQLTWLMDVNTFIRCQSISTYRTMDKLGPNATILTGMLGAVEGIPVIVSEEMKLADTDGKVTDAGNVTDTGRLLIFNRTQWAQGFRREMTIDVDRDTQKRQTIVTVSFRHALSERSGTRSSATHTALQYDITGVS